MKVNITEIPILSDTDGLHITSQAKAESLNKQFVFVFAHDELIKELLPTAIWTTLGFLQPRIEIFLKNIKQTKAAGPDELPARIMK